MSGRYGGAKGGVVKSEAGREEESRRQRQHKA